MFTTLISPEDLAPRLDSPGWVILDCRFDLSDVTAGESAYLRAHLPRAIYAHLDRDLAAPITAISGRHPLPAVDAFERTLRRWGVRSNSQVVVYDGANGSVAARAWWMLRWLGHDAVAVLDGGLEAWRRAGLPLTAEIASSVAGNFTPSERRELWADTDEVAHRVTASDWRVLDVRAPERFAGEREPIDAVAGHIPGAVNHPFTRSVDERGRFLSPVELRNALQVSLGGVSAGRTIVMCGSGVTACHELLALEVAGLPSAKLYPGSWSEWIRDPRRPVATGRS